MLICNGPRQSHASVVLAAGIVFPCVPSLTQLTVIPQEWLPKNLPLLSSALALWSGRLASVNIYELWFCVMTPPVCSLLRMLLQKVIYGALPSVCIIGTQRLTQSLDFSRAMFADLLRNLMTIAAPPRFVTM
jgi:hypothetical protein